jgi:hypothetical protein
MNRWETETSRRERATARRRALLQEGLYLGLVVLAAHAAGWGDGGRTLAAAALVASALPLARLVDGVGRPAVGAAGGVAVVAWGALLAGALAGPLVAGGVLASGLGGLLVYCSLAGRLRWEHRLAGAHLGAALALLLGYSLVVGPVPLLLGAGILVGMAAGRLGWLGVRVAADHAWPV